MSRVNSLARLQALVLRAANSSTQSASTPYSVSSISLLLQTAQRHQQPQTLWQLGHSLRAFTNNPLDDKTIVERQLLVNTLDLARKFEASGLGREPAERLAQYITEIIVMNKVRMEDAFVTKQQLEKIVMEQDNRVLGFKVELTKTSDILHASVNKDLDRQQSFLDKMKTEVRHEIDKLTASQRLDMNLEKGRMRDDLQLIRDKTTELEIKVDRDINELKSSVEKAKNDTIKSVITILGTFSAIAFTISRFMQMANG